MKKLIAIVLIWCLCGFLAFGLYYGGEMGQMRSEMPEWNYSKSYQRITEMQARGIGFACFLFGPLGLAMATCFSGMGYYGLDYPFLHGGEDEENTD